MSTRSVAEFFDSYSHDFNAIYGNQNNLLNSLVNKLLRKSMKLRYFKTLEGCEPVAGKSVLDIGCGPGHYSIALASRGAGKVLGIDFAKGMINLANENARRAGVLNRCRFVSADFLAYPVPHPFDYSIVMGFMDYISEPSRLIAKVLSVTRSKAFFSFPVAGGLLAWQRRLRYQKRCDLFLYRADEVNGLFKGLPGRAETARIDRDFFVSVDMVSGE